MAKTYTPEEAEALVHSHDPEHVGDPPRFSSDAKKADEEQPANLICDLCREFYSAPVFAIRS